MLGQRDKPGGIEVSNVSDEFSNEKFGGTESEMWKGLESSVSSELRGRAVGLGCEKGSQS